MSNKAHAATLRRIRERYGGISGHMHGIDIEAGSIFIEVETWATLADGIARLSTVKGSRYIAVTNKEAVSDAIRLTEGTGIGVMDAHGHILQPADVDGQDDQPIH